MSIKDLVVTMLLGLAVNECSDVSPWLAKKLVRWAAHRLYPDPDRAATRSEELAALIDEIPGKFLKLLTALGFGTRATYVAIRVQANTCSAATLGYLLDVAKGLKAGLAVVVSGIRTIAFIVSSACAVAFVGLMCALAVAAALPSNDAVPPRVVFVAAAIGFFAAVPVFVFTTRKKLARAAAQTAAIAVLFAAGGIVAAVIHDSGLSFDTFWGMTGPLAFVAIGGTGTAWVTRRTRARISARRMRVRASGIVQG